MKNKTTKLLFGLFELMVVGLAIMFVIIASGTIAWWFKAIPEEMGAYIQPALIIVGCWAGAVVMIGMSALDSKLPYDPNNRH